jgi:hypothetical protein
MARLTTGTRSARRSSRRRFDRGGRRQSAAQSAATQSPSDDRDNCRHAARRNAIGRSIPREDALRPLVLPTIRSSHKQFGSTDIRRCPSVAALNFESDAHRAFFDDRIHGNH